MQAAEAAAAAKAAAAEREAAAAAAVAAAAAATAAAATAAAATDKTPTLGFFDAASSTQDKGRLRCADAREFDSKTLFRISDRELSARGVSILKGRRREEYGGQVAVITVLFDRGAFTEGQAEQWWGENAEHYQ